MRIEELYIGQKVKTSLVWNDDTVWVVRIIDEDQEQAYVEDITGGGAGWVSFVGLFFYKGQ